jgi:hypothetical protein
MGQSRSAVEELGVGRQHIVAGLAHRMPQCTAAIGPENVSPRVGPFATSRFTTATPLLTQEFIRASAARH